MCYWQPVIDNSCNQMVGSELADYNQLRRQIFPILCWSNHRHADCDSCNWLLHTDNPFSNLTLTCNRLSFWIPFNSGANTVLADCQWVHLPLPCFHSSANPCAHSVCSLSFCYFCCEDVQLIQLDFILFFLKTSFVCNLEHFNFTMSSNLVRFWRKWRSYWIVFYDEKLIKI